MLIQLTLPCAHPVEAVCAGQQHTQLFAVLKLGEAHRAGGSTMAGAAVNARFGRVRTAVECRRGVTGAHTLEEVGQRVARGELDLREGRQQLRRTAQARGRGGELAFAEGV
jgi:hypothetical protein